MRHQREPARPFNAIRIQPTMNTTLLLFLLLPIVGAAVLFYMNRSDMSWWGAPLAALPGFIVIAVCFAASYGAATSDTEIWNGKITSKNRVHGTYEQPYECMCTTDSKGNRSCSTCYETHYTVNWSCESTIGHFPIDSADSTWRSVYNTPDPGRYTAIIIGEPAARQHSYTNYVQAVPSSLFAVVGDSIRAKFKGQLPPYPIEVYDYYRINRFVSTSFAYTDAAQWNQDISNMLKELGPQKQVNAIIVVTKNTDPTFADALRDQWNGMKKNDVVLVIGTADGQKIDWVRVESWTKNELFKVELRDAIMDIGNLYRPAIISTFQAQIAKNFERRHMAEFAYLKGEIDPPTWLLILMTVLLIGGYGGAIFFFLRDKAAPRRYGNYPGPD